MATTFPLASLAAVVTADGITAPPFSDIYQSLQASFQSIYGADAYIDPDSQDGQLLAVFARAISDCNDAAIAIYNSYSPATSLSAALSNNVKINGLRRGVPSNSQVDLLVSGTIGTIVTLGVAVGDDNTRWNLPSVVEIPPAGSVLVTATASAPGAISAAPGTITRIGNPQLGWQSVTNPSDASEGAPVESDADLRRRQSVSTGISAQTVLDGVVAAVSNLAGVTQAVGYDNDTNATDANGIPAHSTALVVIGGDSQAIADTYMRKKAPGAGTYGTTVVNTTSATGVPYIIRYFVTTDVPIAVSIAIKARVGYSTAVGDQIKASVAAYINALGIGKRVDQGRLYMPAQLYGGAGYLTFEVNQILLAVKPGVPANADIETAFNARAVVDVADIALVVTP